MILFTVLAGCMLVCYAACILIFRLNRCVNMREVILSDDGKPGTEIHIQMTQGALTRLYADVMTSPAMLRLLSRVAWLFVLRAGVMYILAALFILSGIFLYGCFDHAAFRDVSGTDWAHIHRNVWHYQPVLWQLFTVVKCYGDMHKYDAPGRLSDALHRIFASRVAARYGLDYHPSMIAREISSLSR